RRSNSAAAGGIGAEVAVIQGRGEGYRRVAIGVHRRGALEPVLEHAESAAERGLAVAGEIPGEAETPAVVKSAGGVESAGVAVLSADGGAIRYRAGAGNEQADERVRVELAGARIDRNALARCRIDGGHVEHGRICAIVECGVEAGDRVVVVGLR